VACFGFSIIFYEGGTEIVAHIISWHFMVSAHRALKRVTPCVPSESTPSHQLAGTLAPYGVCLHQYSIILSKLRTPDTIKNGSLKAKDIWYYQCLPTQ